jgi:hypothetical protein
MRYLKEDKLLFMLAIKLGEMATKTQTQDAMQI